MKRSAASLATVSAFLCLNLLGSGCPPTDEPAGDSSPDGTSGTGTPQDTEPIMSDFSNAGAASLRLARVVEAGMASPDALSQLKQELQTDPRVAGILEPEDNSAVWAFYQSGLCCIYDIVDDDEDLELPLDLSLTQQRIVTAAGARLARAAKPLPTAQPAGNYLQTKVPASSRALLANSLTIGQPLQDIRAPISKMLSDRGYQVDSKEASLEVFKHLTGYGIIFIEAHGSALLPLEFVSDTLRTAIDQLVPQDQPNSGLAGGNAVLFTNTPATDAACGQYQADVSSGRLKVRLVTVRKPGQASTVGKFFAVTPNFIRQHNSARFADRTFLFVNACASFHSSGSPWLDLMTEKSKGGGLVGWYKQVHYGISSRAMLNLFQFATGSNEEFKLTSQRSGKDYYLLRKNTPPVTTATLSGALGPLTQKGWDRDPTGAVLGMSWDWTANLYNPALAPELRLLQTSQDSRALLLQTFCADNDQFSIGSVIGEIGTYAQQSLPPHLYAEGYKISLPPGANGRMKLVQSGRSGVGRDLLAYKPTIKLSGGGAQNMQYTITLQLYGRGMPVPRGSFWDPPTDEYAQIRFEEAASTVQWSVNGSWTDGVTQVTWSGSGMLKCRFYDPTPESGLHYDSAIYIAGPLPDGLTAKIDVNDYNALPYTQTSTSLLTGEVTTTIHYLYALVGASDVPVSSSLVVSAGSYTLSGETVSWPDMSPTPAYDRATSPR